MKTFDIISGIDGDYIIDNGSLHLIINIDVSSNYKTSKNGVWKRYTIENGKKFTEKSLFAFDLRRTI